MVVGFLSGEKQGKSITKKNVYTVEMWARFKNKAKYLTSELESVLFIPNQNLHCTHLTMQQVFIFDHYNFNSRKNYNTTKNN